MGYTFDEQLDTELKMLRDLFVDLVAVMPNDLRTHFLEKVNKRIHDNEQHAEQLNQPKVAEFPTKVSYGMAYVPSEDTQKEEIEHRLTLLRNLQELVIKCSEQTG